MDEYKYIDAKPLKALTGGDSEFMVELLDLFLSQIPEFTSNMKNSLETQDWDLLAKEAHTAKSSALTFGMEKTGILLKDIQLKSEANELHELPELVRSAIQQMEAAMTELLSLKNTLV